MDDKAGKLKRRWPTYLAIVLVLVFVVYPLSIGPASVVDHRWQNKNFTAVGAALYHPLLWIAEASNTNDILAAYVMWWTHYTPTGTNPPGTQELTPL